MDEIQKKAAKRFSLKVENTYKYHFVFRMPRCYMEYLPETGRLKLALEDGFLKFSRV